MDTLKIKWLKLNIVSHGIRKFGIYTTHMEDRV